MDRRQISLLTLSNFERAMVLWFKIYGFLLISGVIELYWFEYIWLILEAKLGDNPLRTACIYLTGVHSPPHSVGRIDFRKTLRGGMRNFFVTAG